jgi:hypothetical protein
MHLTFSIKVDRLRAAIRIRQAIILRTIRVSENPLQIEGIRFFTETSLTIEGGVREVDEGSGIIALRDVFWKVERERRINGSGERKR